MKADDRRVALVHDWLTGMRGGEKVLEALATPHPTAPIYTLFHFPGSVSPELERHPIHTTFLQRAPLLRRRYRHYLPLFPAAIESFRLPADIDLVLSSSHCVAKGILPPPGAAHVCYCHTPMRYAWDQEHAYFPRRHGLVARLRGQILSRLRTWDVAASARVDLFLANSRFVAQRIQRYYRRSAEILPPPVDTAFFTPAGPDPAGRSPRYALAVSAFAPYKRLEVAMAACERAGIELRVVGDGPERARLAALAGGTTRLLGRVDGEALRELYRGAACFVQPQVEDFGIAAAEALACGTPVVARGAGGVLDIVEDGRHGILYEAAAGANAGAGDGDAEVAAMAAAVAQAIDKNCEIQSNTLDLRRRAEAFALPRFEERLRSLLAAVPAPVTLGGSIA